MQDAYGEMKAGGGAVRELQPCPPSDTPHLLVPITARMLSTLLPPSVFSGFTSPFPFATVSLILRAKISFRDRRRG